MQKSSIFVEVRRRELSSEGFVTPRISIRVRPCIISLRFATGGAKWKYRGHLEERGAFHLAPVGRIVYHRLYRYTPESRIGYFIHPAYTYLHPELSSGSTLQCATCPRGRRSKKKTIAYIRRSGFRSSPALRRIKVIKSIAETTCGEKTTLRSRRTGLRE